MVIIDSGASIDLLFTDVVMPGALGAAELARKVQLRLPGMPVLFTSGYTDNAIVHGGRLDEGVELLSKPYTRDDLARKLRKVLGNNNCGVATNPNGVSDGGGRADNADLAKPA
jgi:two-component SAPR family response regulator